MELSIHSGRFKIDLREMHEVLESNRAFSCWAKTKLERFTEDQDFVVEVTIVPREGPGASKKIDYFATLQTAMHVAISHNSQKGLEVRQYLIEKAGLGETFEVAETEMIEDVAVKDTEFGVDLRPLHKKLESKQKFADWAKAKLSQFDEGKDYVTDRKIMIRKNARGASKQIDYYVSLDVAKHIALMENTEKGREVRQYFIEVEKEFRGRNLSLQDRLSPNELLYQKLQSIEVNDQGTADAFMTLLEAYEDRAGVSFEPPVVGLLPDYDESDSEMLAFLGEAIEMVFGPDNIEPQLVYAKSLYGAMPEEIKKDYKTVTDFDRVLKELIGKPIPCADRFLMLAPFSKRFVWAVDFFDETE